MGVGPSLSNDIHEIVDVINGTARATGPIDSTNGFKIAGTSINSVVTAKTGDTGTVKAGTYTAVAGDDTAGEKDIDTGLTTITSYTVQILRAGVPISSDQVISKSGGTITVADGASTYDITTGDVINWIAVGAL